MGEAGAKASRPKVKRQHHKVLTGCATCRRRRIKCGEERPACAKCQRYGVKCGGYRDREISGTHNGSNPKYNTYPVVLASVHVRYGTLEQARCLHFYLRWTGPMISSAATVKDMWTVIMPQVSWQSPPIKCMLCALSLLDQNWVEPVAEHFTTAGYQKATRQYYNAISALTKATAPRLANAILFSIMAWCFDIITNNRGEAALHDKATREMLAECKKPSAQLRVDERLITERAKCMFVHGNVIFGRAYRQEPQHFLVFTNLDEARRGLYHVIEKAGSTKVPDGSGHDLARQRLEEWRNGFEQYRYSGPGPLSQKRSVYLAQNLVSTYLVLTHPDSLGSSWGSERDCVLIMNDLESLLAAYDNLDDLRWIMRLVLLAICDIAEGMQDIVSRAEKLLRVLKKTPFSTQVSSGPPNFFVSTEAATEADHKAVRRARALVDEKDGSRNRTSLYTTFAVEAPSSARTSETRDTQSAICAQ